jgi:hypothetical protein
MRTAPVGVLAGFALGLAGCASIVAGKNQPISVETRHKGQPVKGAHCELMNDKGKWFVTTPGSIMIQKSYGDLAVRCEKEGLDPGIATVRSTAGMVWGNIVFGGLIGLAVDATQGAGYDYPALVTVEMGASTLIEAPKPEPQEPAQY